MGLASCTLAVKLTGEVWAWGNNPAGQLGNQTTTSYSSPVLVVGGHSFIEVAGGGYHTLARKANGEVWAWGYNLYGQLGNQTITSYSSPVLVVGSHIFSDIGPAFASLGASWGAADPTIGGQRILSWQEWNLEEVIGDQDWGEIATDPQSRVSPVVDTGLDGTKKFTISQTVEGSVRAFIRTQDALFLATDTTPAWVAYSGAAVLVGRYVQVMVVN